MWQRLAEERDAKELNSLREDLKAKTELKECTFKPAVPAVSRKVLLTLFCSLLTQHAAVVIAVNAAAEVVVTASVSVSVKKYMNHCVSPNNEELSQSMIRWVSLNVNLQFTIVYYITMIPPPYIVFEWSSQEG